MSILKTILAFAVLFYIVLHGFRRIVMFCVSKSYGGTIVALFSVGIISVTTQVF